MWKFGGRTGEGIESAGELLARAAKNDGRYVNTFREFPSVIKGGYTSCEVRLADRPVNARGDEVDVGVALDEESVARIAPELDSEALLLYDKTISLGERPSLKPRPGQQWKAVPLTELAQANGSKIMRNMVALGMSGYVLDIDRAALHASIRQKFAKKGDPIVSANLRALDAGWESAATELDARDRRVARARISGDMVIASGNDALAFGALSAGCRLYAGYPITPASGVLEWMAEHLPKFGGAVVQSEDEIAALLMVTGAFYAGCRAMTATSGPGISLMTEAFGLPAMTETPAVIIDEQRPGPSSGMPTKHEQGDLTHVVFSSHGDAPRIVLTPNSVSDCFDLAGEAFRLAEKYQCPTFVLVDQDLALRTHTVPRFRLDGSVRERQSLVTDDESARLSEGSYERYRDTPSGISPRALPGQANSIFLASGDEHHPDGKIDVEWPSVRKAAMEKRMRKLDGLWRDLPALTLRDHLGAEHRVSDRLEVAYLDPVEIEPADCTLVSIGATSEVVAEILPHLAADGIAAQQLAFRYVWPFPERAVSRALQKTGRVVVVEQNYSGQLLLLVKAFVGRHETIESIRKYDGTPFRPRELLERVKEVVERQWRHVDNL